MAEISLTGDHLLTVLEVIAQKGPIGVTEIATICNTNRTVTHRLLATLSARSFVRRSGRDYVLGPAVFRLVQKADRDLRTAAKPVMQRLAAETGETVVLHALDNLEAVVVDQAYGTRHLVRVAHSPGSRHALHKGASGWALLAFQPERLIARVVKKAGDAEGIKQRIETTRRDGYSITHDELQLGVHGVAVPLREDDRGCELSLGILVPSSRVEQLDQFVPLLKYAAEEIVQAGEVDPSPAPER